MVDIFDEVDEELRADRAEALLKRYGGVIIGAAVLIVAATGAWQGWRWWQARQEIAAAEAYLAVSRQADATTTATQAAERTALAGSFDALASGAPSGYRTLARLRAAGLRAQAGDRAAAAADALAIAADSATDPVLRDYATLLAIQYQIDDGDPAQLQARLAPLLAPDNPWRGLAREAQAVLTLRQGQTEQAKAQLADLAKDVTAPDGVRARANALLGRLGG